MELRLDAPPYFRELIRNLGDIPITSLTVCKTPIQKAIDNIINLVSFGTWNKAKSQYNYDDMFHLFLIIELADEHIIRLEKNQTLSIITVPNYKPTSDTVCMPITYTGNSTLRSLMDNAVEEYGPEQIYLYSGTFNNCQRFVSDLLIASDIIQPTEQWDTATVSNGYIHTTISGQIGVFNDDDKIYSFINQNAANLFNSMPQIIGFGSQLITDSAAFADRVFYGRGKQKTKIKDLKVEYNDTTNGEIQAVLFSNSQFTEKQAEKYLKDRLLYNIKPVHETANYLRYRILEPNQFDYFKTFRISKGILYVIGYSGEP